MTRKKLTPRRKGAKNAKKIFLRLGSLCALA